MGFTLSWSQWLRTDTENFKRFQWMFNKFLKYSTVIEENTDRIVIKAIKDPQYDYTFAVERNLPPDRSFFPTLCKTGREPYTEDVAIGLILMVEFGIADEIHADDNKYIYNALETIHKQYPLKNYNKIKDSLVAQDTAK